MKKKTGNKRQPLSKFLIWLEEPRGLVYEWSLERSPNIFIQDPVTKSLREVANVNLKEFASVPFISKADLKIARDWNLESKQIRSFAGSYFVHFEKKYLKMIARSTSNLWTSVTGRLSTS